MTQFISQEGEVTEPQPPGLPLLSLRYECNSLNIQCNFICAIAPQFIPSHFLLKQTPPHSQEGEVTAPPPPRPPSPPAGARPQTSYPGPASLFF